MRTPGCFVSSISDELYGPILDAVPAQPSSTKDLECIQNINHQTNQTTSNFNTGWDIPATPGDFANVARQHRFRKFVNPEGFITAVVHECRMKEGGDRKRVGF